MELDSSKIAEPTNQVSSQGHLIVKLLEELDQEVPYVYLRNYQELPDIVGNDVDLLIPKGSKEKALKILSERAEQHGWKYLRSVEFGSSGVFFVRDDFCDFVHVDLFESLEWHYLRYADAERVIKNREWNGQVYRPKKSDELIINIMTRLLYMGVVREKHRKAAIQSFRAGDGPELEECFHFHLGEALGNEVFFRVAEFEWEELCEEYSKVRYSLLRKLMKSEPIRVSASFLRYMRRGARRLMNPPGPFLVFLTEDGAELPFDKKEFINFLVGITGRHDPRFFSWKPTPSMTGKQSELLTDSTKAEEKKRGLIGSLFALAGHWVGSWIGYVRCLLSFRARNSAVLGRGYTARLLLRPESLGLKLPTWLRILAAKTLPAPNHVILFSSAEDTEHSHQLLSKAFKCTTVVPASLDAKEVQHEVRLAILTKFFSKNSTLKNQDHVH